MRVLERVKTDAESRWLISSTVSNIPTAVDVKNAPINPTSSRTPRSLSV